MHWIQVIPTNFPGDNYGAQQEGSSVWHVDNYDNPPGDPYYDTLATANPTDFVDEPSRPYRNDTFGEDI